MDLSNVTDRDLEIDRDMEHESDTDYPLINKRILNKNLPIDTKTKHKLCGPKRMK